MLFLRGFGDKRHAEVAEKSFGLVLPFCSGNDGNGEAENVFKVFIRGFWKDGVLLDADGDITHVINRFAERPRKSRVRGSAI